MEWDIKIVILIFCGRNCQRNCCVRAEIYYLCTHMHILFVCAQKYIICICAEIYHLCRGSILGGVRTRARDSVGEGCGQGPRSMHNYIMAAYILQYCSAHTSSQARAQGKNILFVYVQKYIICVRAEIIVEEGGGAEMVGECHTHL